MQEIISQKRTPPTQHCVLIYVFEIPMIIVIKNDFSSLKRNFSDLVKVLYLKTELELKIFEVIKEENKNKYNYPIINLSAFKLNNENIKKSLNQINDSIMKFGTLLGSESNCSVLNLFGIDSHYKLNIELDFPKYKI